MAPTAVNPAKQSPDMDSIALNGGMGTFFTTTGVCCPLKNLIAGLLTFCKNIEFPTVELKNTGKWKTFNAYVSTTRISSSSSSIPQNLYLGCGSEGLKHFRLLI